MQTTSALAPSLISTRNSRTLREVLLVLAGTAVLYASAKISVPFYPVPMTLQTLAVMAIAAAYGMRLGTLTVLAYLGEGLAGLPVFTSTPPAVAGPLYFLGGTGGFLAGFILLALIVGYAADRGWDRSFAHLFGAMIVADVVVFAMGFVWLAAFAHLGSKTGLGFSTAWAKGVVPFLLGDLLKIALASALIPASWSLLGDRAVPQSERPATNELLEWAIGVVAVSVIAMVWGISYTYGNRWSAAFTGGDDTYRAAGWIALLGFLGFLVGLALLVGALVRSNKGDKT